MNWDVFKSICMMTASLILAVAAFILLLCECDSFLLLIATKIVGFICAVLSYRLSPLYYIDKDDFKDER